MAVGNNNSNTKVSSGKYSTDEKVMMADAKQYASRDFKEVLEVHKRANIKLAEMKEANPEAIIDEDLVVAQVLTEYKYEVIKASRTNRVSYFD